MGAVEMWQNSVPGAQQFAMNQSFPESCPVDFSAWTPADDLLLKNAVESGAVLEALAKGAVRFSRRFTLKDLQERWHALLYDPQISGTAASGMLDVELSQASSVKQNQPKLKSNQLFICKKKPHSVRNHFYQMKKRIDAENIMALDNCIFSSDALAACFGNVQQNLEETTGMSTKLPIADDMDVDTFPSAFGLPNSTINVADQALNHMDIYLASDGVNEIESAFHGNMDSLAVTNPVGITNDCFGYSDHGHYDMLTDAVIDVGKEPVSSASTNQLAHHLQHAGPENAVLHHTSYTETGGLTLDQIRTALNSDNDPGVDSVLEFAHKSHLCRSIDADLFSVEGKEQECSLEHHSDVGHVKQVHCERLILQNAHSLSQLNGDDTYACKPTEGPGRENLNTTYNVSEDHGKIVPKSEPLECVDFGAVICDEGQGFNTASVSANDKILSGKIDKVVLEIAPEFRDCSSAYHDKNQLHLYVNEPFVCAINEQQLEVPSNDEFTPLAAQDALPLLSVPAISELEQGDNEGLQSIKAVPSSQIPAFSGKSAVKAEPESSEKNLEATNEAASAAKAEKTRDSFTSCQVKTEKFDLSVPAMGCHDKVGRDEHPTSSQSFPNVNTSLQEKASFSQNAKMDDLNNRFVLAPSHEAIQAAITSTNTPLELKRELHNEVAIAATSVQDNPNHVSQSDSLDLMEFGLENPHMIRPEEMPEHSFLQDDFFSASDEEIPAFSDVENMVLGMELTEEEEPLYNGQEFQEMFKRHSRLIARLEQTADAATQRSLSSKGALAILYGRHLKYFITKTEVSIGRETQENIVDIDLGKEGRANKVSRRQATIKAREDGIFYLKNHGRRTIYVNGHAVEKGHHISLTSNCLIEIGGMRFIFEMNKKLIKKLRDES